MERAKIEDTYAKALLELSKSTLGDIEFGYERAESFQDDGVCG